jgi:hypothetical protein
MRALFFSTAALLLGGLPTVCGSDEASPPPCPSCNAPEVCATLCLEAGPDIIATGCVSPRDGGYVARDGGPFVACPGY